MPFVISTLLCVVLAELAARAFWCLRYEVPFRDPSRILYAYYPELRNVDRKRPARGDGFYSILLLGGSALHPEWGEVPQVLAETLAYSGHRNVRIFNLAMPAQTSRDSWLKYAALREARFDLVVLYHGINEARTNNAPPNIFREDYAHYAWYEIVNTLAPYHGSTSFALPYTLRYLVVSMRHILMKDRYVPLYAPRKDWFGMDGTTAARCPLDPIEEWGRREDVLETVAVENEIVRTLAVHHTGVLFVDQASLMAGSAHYFNDPCH